jgi:hypothetical protein
MWSKVQEKDRFYMRKPDMDGSINLTPRELEWLLDGVDIQKIKIHNAERTGNYSLSS